MLDKIVFLQGINYLKKNYRNFDYDVNDKDLLNVWYSKFENMENNTFIKVVEAYTNTYMYPPNSPLQLIETFSNLLIDKELKPIQAWEKVRGLIIEYGFYYNRSEIYKALENNQVLTETVREFESSLINYQSNDLTTAKAFQKAYSENLKARKQTEIQFAIENKNVLRIEG